MRLDLDDYRARAERFLEEHDREYLEHFAGLKASYDVAAVFERHAALFADDAIDGLRESRQDAAADGGERARRARLLLGFAVEGRLGQATRALDEELARREASIALALPGGRRIGLREAPAAQMNEPDAERRAEIEAARLDAATRELTPLQRERWERSHAAARELGLAELPGSCGSELTGVDLGALGGQCEAFLDATGESHPRPARLGAAPHDRGAAGPCAAQRPAALAARRGRPTPITRPSGCCPPSARRWAGWASTCTSRGTCWSTSSRGRPSRRARSARPCACPAEVHLVVPPMGGRDDYAALFHEGGHAQHYAAVDRGLAVRVPPPGRQRGDRGVRVPLRARHRGRGLAPGGAGRSRPRAAPRARDRAAAVLPAALRRQARLRARAARGAPGRSTRSPPATSAA